MVAWSSEVGMGVVGSTPSSLQFLGTSVPGQDTEP